MPQALRRICGRKNWTTMKHMIGMLYTIRLTYVACELHMEDVRLYASRFSESLHSMFDIATGFPEMKQQYEELYTTGKMYFAETDGQDLGKQFAKNVKIELQSRAEALQRIKKRAEHLASSHEYDESIERFTYKRNFDDYLANLTKIHPTFANNVFVNFSESFVQVPTNVFAYSKEVLNVVRWSSALDEVFISNFNSSNTLLWQYLGSATGVFRSYPGNWEPTSPGFVDSYDCRRRLWYIQPSGASKDFVIVLDSSGSMTALKFRIARLAITALINTFQENDFFNVIYVNEELNYLKPCLQQPIQATIPNKEMMASLVDYIPNPKGRSGILRGFRAALELLTVKNFRAEYSCNKVMAIISDGIDDSVAEVMMKELKPEYRIRVFTYLTGGSKDTSQAAMKRLACNNGGYLYKLETFGSVWDNILNYVAVLSRVQSRSQQTRPPTYSPVYLDASNLGTMITVALAIYDRNPERLGSLVGAAGIDIALSTLLAQQSKEYLGAAGYTFMTNNNGVIVLHPLFRDPVDVPNPTTLFLDQIEFSVNKSHIVTLMRSMIDEKNGTRTFPVYRYNYKKNGRWLEIRTMSYYHVPVAGTPYSCAVVLETNRMKHIRYSDLYYSEVHHQGVRSLAKDLNDSDIFVANWKYCNIRASEQDYIPAVITAYPTVEELKSHFEQSGGIPSNCDATLVRGLLVSAAIMQNISQRFWNAGYMKQHGVEYVYGVSNFGFAKVLMSNVSGPRLLLNRDVHSEDFYQHADQHARSFDAVLVISVPVKPHAHAQMTSEEFHKPTLSVSKAVSIGGENITAAVLGLELFSDFLNDWLAVSATECPDEIIENSTHRLNCSRQSNYDCYILDESGYVVATNVLNSMTGMFFGSVHGQLTTHFLDPSVAILQKHIMEDYQAECEVPSRTITSSSARIHSMMLALHRVLIYIIQSIIQKATFLLTDTVRVDANQIIPAKNVTCVKVVPIYSFLTQYAAGTLSNRECTLNYALSPVPRTNLFLLVTEDIGARRCQQTPYVSSTPYQKEEDTTCQSRVVYRRQLPGCYKAPINETAACSRGKLESAKPLLSSFLFVLGLLYEFS